MGERKAGGCLCGKVRYEATLEDTQYNMCHCNMCRKWSAGPMMAVHFRGDDVTYISAETLKWYVSSDWAERGFCSECGTSLFYRLRQQPEMMLVASIETLDDASGITLERHIFADQASPHYEFADKTPRVTKAEMLVEFGVAPDGA